MKPIHKYTLLILVGLGIFFTLAVAGAFLVITGIETAVLWRELRKPVEHRMLFIGNSFTYQNNLDRMVGSMINAQQSENNQVFITRITFGGYRLVDHLDDTFENEDDSNIREFLIDGSPQVRNWDVVVFQEYVPLPDLPDYEFNRTNSISSAVALGQFAHQSGANVMFMQTWGYALHPDDPENSYPEFPRMQAHLANANYDMSQALQDEDVPAMIAPAGHSFLIVYQDVLAAGIDPFNKNSDFMRLYAEDKKHPSIAGTYLAAAVITATYLDEPVVDFNWIPPGLDQDFARYLREVADRVVFGSQFP
ncbi:MAG: DUF4886 domain-containing protein [Chloroflexota bacterium]